MSVRLVLLGPPGSGKGTQGKRLAEHFGIPHISTGDLIRDQIARGTVFGRKVEEGIAAGNFAPDADILALVRERLLESDALDGYVLDGFPRDLAQGKLFTDQLGSKAASLTVIELQVCPEAVIDRLAGRLVCPVCDAVYHSRYCPPKAQGVCDRDAAALHRRPDDEPDAVRHRLDVYETETLPLRKFYEDLGQLRSIAAEGDAVQVFSTILSTLAHDGVR